MIELLQIVQGVVERGLIFGFIVAAVYVSSRLISFDNLAVEGAFGLGGACTALLINAEMHPGLGLLGALVAGSLSGVITGLLNSTLKLNNLISGIVVTTGLFSITLRMAGAHSTLSGKTSLFMCMPSFLGSYQALFFLTIFSAVVFCAINWFLKTEVGFLLQAAGDTPQMVTNVGKSVKGYTMLGLMLSNGLAALSGALFVQYTGYFSLWTSVGVLVIGLVGMILAQAFTPHFGIALLVGSIIYQVIIAATFELQLNQDWNKLITASLIVFLIIIKQQLHKK